MLFPSTTLPVGQALNFLALALRPVFCAIWSSYLRFHLGVFLRLSSIDFDRVTDFFWGAFIWVFVWVFLGSHWPFHRVFSSAVIDVRALSSGFLRLRPFSAVITWIRDFSRASIGFSWMKLFFFRFFFAFHGFFHQFPWAIMEISSILYRFFFWMFTAFLTRFCRISVEFYRVFLDVTLLLTAFFSIFLGIVGYNWLFLWHWNYFLRIIPF